MPHTSVNRREFLKDACFAGLAVPLLPAMEQHWEDLNIIFIISDQHRRPSCGCYGDPIRTVDGQSPTPNIDKLAARGVVFDKMYTASPLCAPARASLMSSMLPHRNLALHHAMGGPSGLKRFPGIKAGVPAMGDVFRSAGYRTAAVGKMHVYGETKDGWDLGFDVRSMRLYSQIAGHHYNDIDGNGDLCNRYREAGDYRNTPYREIDPPRFASAPPDITPWQNRVNPLHMPSLIQREEGMMDNLVAKQSISFMRDCVKTGQKFMIHVGFEKPHLPWTATKRFMEMYDWRNMPLPETIDEARKNGEAPYFHNYSYYQKLTHKDAQRSMAGYYACVSALDENVGKVLKAVEDLGIEDRTVIVYTSDHGEHLYEHGQTGKDTMLESSVGVPLVIAGPGIRAGGRFDYPASTIDITPTLCDLSGVPVPQVYEGESLVPAMRGEADKNKKIVFSEYYETWKIWRKKELRQGIDIVPFRMVVYQDYKYIYSHGCLDQLYDRNKDPQEVNNLALDAAHDSLRRTYRLICMDSWELKDIPLFRMTADEVDDGGILLRWEAPEVAGSFHVWRSENGDVRSARQVGRGSKSLFHDQDVKSGTTYTYWVTTEFKLERPYVDPQGKSRFGACPIFTKSFPLNLPASNSVAVTAV